MAPRPRLHNVDDFAKELRLQDGQGPGDRQFRPLGAAGLGGGAHAGTLPRQTQGQYNHLHQCATGWVRVGVGAIGNARMSWIDSVQVIGGCAILYAAFHTLSFLTDRDSISQYSVRIRILLGILVLCGAFSLIASMQRAHAEIDQEKHAVYWVNENLWGLSTDRFELRWRIGSEGGAPAWCAKGGDGKWYPYFVDSEITSADLQ